MEALLGPFYGLLFATDPYMELCPHVCYFRQIVDKEMLISQQLVLFLAFCTLKNSVFEFCIRFLICSTEFPRSQNGQIPLNFLMLLVSIGPVLALLPPPYCASDYAQGPHMDLNPKVIFSYGHFSHLGILAIFEGPFVPFYDLGVPIQVISRKKCSFVINLLCLEQLFFESAMVLTPSSGLQYSQGMG